VAALETSGWRPWLVGGLSLAVVVWLYSTISAATTQPTAVFLVPPMLSALLGHWRPAAVVGTISVMIGVAFGIAGPLDNVSVFARFLLNSAVVVAVALLAYRREREHREVLELAQRSSLYHVFESGLLPDPQVPAGFDLVVRFVAAEEQMALGGDLLDAVDLSDGRMAFVIGDVCGHGPREAAFATAVRAGWRTVVRTHRPDPSAWLSDLRRTIYSDASELPYVTLCTGIVDRSNADVTLAIAGHPPPVAISERSRPLSLTFGLPLGVDPLSRWPNQRVPIGSGLLLYTDGLVDNPAVDGPADRWGENGLVGWMDRWSADHSVPVTRFERSQFADRLIAAARSGRDIRDDLAVMIVAIDKHPSLLRPRVRHGERHERASAN
jgi:hypothetical protein